MSVDVPDRSCHHWFMDPNEDQRRDLAARLEAVRIDRYESDRQRTYTAVGVNASTWKKAESGIHVAERSLHKIVKKLWPETGGDWRRLDPPLSAVAPDDELAAKVRSSNLDSDTKDYILARLAAMQPTPPTPPEPERKRRTG